MSISLKAVLMLCGLGAAAFIALILVNAQSQNINIGVEIEAMILALIVTVAAGFLYLGEKLDAAKKTAPFVPPFPPPAR